MSSQPMQSGQASPPAASPEFLDRSDPEAEIARAVRSYSNWGRWGADDVLGTANFITDGLRLAAAGLVRRGASFSLSQRFDMDGPQRGWRRRTNPVHTMLDTGTDAALGNQGFPHGIGGADDVIAMPLQCSTQWDGLGHIFDHGKAWNGRDAARTVTSDGDLVTGIEQLARRLILLKAARAVGGTADRPGDKHPGQPVTDIVTRPGHGPGQGYELLTTIMARHTHIGCDPLSPVSGRSASMRCASAGPAGVSGCGPWRAGVSGGEPVGAAEQEGCFP